MSRRMFSLIAVSLIGAILLGMVVQARIDDGIAPTAPLLVEASLRTLPPEPAVNQPPTSTQEAAMAIESNDTGPLADLVSQVSAHESLYAVEVVKNLTPSVVQIATEALAIGSFNQPVPSRGVGTGAPSCRGSQMNRPMRASSMPTRRATPSTSSNAVGSCVPAA